MKRTALKRRTPIRRKAWMKRGKVKSAYRRRTRDFSFMQWARRQPCVARPLSMCEGRVQADHAGKRGLGQKCPDHECIPLCRTHHMQRTAFAGPFKDWDQAKMREWLERQMISTSHEYTLYVVREKRQQGDRA
jgi:hypothetical protein